MLLLSPEANAVLSLIVVFALLRAREQLVGFHVRLRAALSKSFGDP